MEVGRVISLAVIVGLLLGGTLLSIVKNRREPRLRRRPTLTMGTTS